MEMDKEAILRQSQSAYKQWASQWREHCESHSKFDMKPMENFIASGVGKAVLLVANGHSFEDKIETIKELQGKVDILCCDKTLGHLLDNGITPTFCMVCDANVDYDKYMKPWEDKLKDVTLFINVCANPKWSHQGTWKDIYFFVNKDILKSEEEFSSLSGCKNIIPAGTNVSNAMIILLTQSDNKGRKNFFGYDKMILIGYDYSWEDGKYYAFNGTGNGKNNYMRHIYGVNQSGSLCFTSNNLMFSAKWLDKYISTFRLPIVNGSDKTMLNAAKCADKLSDQMDYEYKTEDRSRVRGLLMKRKSTQVEMIKIENELNNIGKDHWDQFQATV